MEPFNFVLQKVPVILYRLAKVLVLSKFLPTNAVPDRGLIINGADHVKAIAQHVSVNTDSFTLSITLNSMKPRITIVACLVFAILWLDHSYLAAQSLNPNQQLIIFDTDIGNDVDDVLASGVGC